MTPETALTAFWHRTRREFVPLISREFKTRTKGRASLKVLTKSGLVEMKSNNTGWDYQITPAGIARLMASGWQA